MTQIVPRGALDLRLLRAAVFVLLLGSISVLSLRPENSRAITPAPFIVTEVNPDASTVPQPPNADSGGRVNGLAVWQDNPAIVYAASEWGGIYRSTDGGTNWQRLPGHRPNATWDVAVDPRNSCADGVDNGADGATDSGDDDCPAGTEDGGLSRIVYATSFYDGRTDNLTRDSDGGINVSYDGGNTWKHAIVPPPTDGVDADLCDGVARIGRDDAGWPPVPPTAGDGEPSAFGIAIRQDNARKAFIGTKCGVAFTLNSGATWAHVDPNPATPGGRVWDVVVHGSGILDICGDDGHFRSLDDGMTWVDRDAASANALPPTASTDVCSIAASPLEPDTLIATVASALFETRDGGVNWAQIGTISGGRVPFVTTNLSDAGAEVGAQCNNSIDSDGDGIINDGCGVVGTDKEDSLQCGNDLDDDGDNEPDDGCGGAGDPAAFGRPAPEVNNTCGNATDDDDLDGKINDGCPAMGAAEAGADCDDAADDDTDGFVNDGCFFPAGSNNPDVISGDNSEGADTNQCDDNKDNDADGTRFPLTKINDGCPRRSFDLYVGDGVLLHRLPCADSVGATIGCAETGAHCGNATDDDGDGTANDGCAGGPGVLTTATQVDAGSHADPGDLEFHSASGTVPACPLYYSNDGGVYKSLGCLNGPEAACGEASGAAVDDDGDGKVNDGCPPNGAAEAECDQPQGDEDNDTDVNDGCIWTRAMSGIHGQWLWALDGASQCDGNADDDSDGAINDGCLASAAAEVDCADAGDTTDAQRDDDGDGKINDGCASVGAAESIDIYSGSQDTGLWFSRDGGNQWGNPACCDVFDVAADAGQIVFTPCCFSFSPPTPGIPNAALQRAPSSNPAAPVDMNLPPSGWIAAFAQQDAIATFGPNSYVMVTTSCSASGDPCEGRGAGGVFITTNNGGPTTETGGGPNSCNDQQDNNADGFGDWGLDNSMPRDGDFTDPGDFGPDPSCSSGWTQVGTPTTTPPGACGVQVAMNGATPTFYVLTHECSGPVDNDRDGRLNEDPAQFRCDDGADTGVGDGADAADPDCHFDGVVANTFSYDRSRGEDGANEDADGFVDEDQGAQLWKYTGTAPGGAWIRIDRDGAGVDLASVGVFAVHPRDPLRLYVADVTQTGFEIRKSINGGTDWTNDDTIEGLLGSGVFVTDRPVSGPLDFSTHGAYAQPSLFEFSPHFSGDDNVILAGGRDSGLYISTDNGGSWEKLAITPRCGNGIDEDADGGDGAGPLGADDGCHGGGAAIGEPELDEDIPRPWHAYFDPSGIFYVGTEGRGIWKVTGLGPSAANLDTPKEKCVVGAFAKIILALVRLAPDGETVGAHLSDLDRVLKLLDVSLAGNSGLNLGQVLTQIGNSIDPNTTDSIQEFIDKLERHVSSGGLSGNIAGVDVIFDAGFDIVGGQSVKLTVNLTLSKLVNANLDLTAGGDTDPLGLTVDGSAPVLLTMNASLAFGFDAPSFDPADPNSCDATFFIDEAGIRFGAQTTVRDLSVVGKLGFFKLGTTDQFSTPSAANAPPEPDEGADIDADAFIRVGLVDPNSSCSDGYDNGPDGTTDLTDDDCHTDGTAASTDSYDPARSEDGQVNRISVQEAQNAAINDLATVRAKGHVHAVLPIRTNLFDVTAPETDCTAGESAPLDDDSDGLVNDGCASDGSPESGDQCAEGNDLDDDDGGSGPINEGCPRSNPRTVFDYSLNPGNPSLELLDSAAVDPFNNLNSLSFLTALRELLQWLQSMQNTGALDTEVPFMDATLGDVVAVADRLLAAMDRLIDPATGDPTFGDAEEFQTAFREALEIALGVPAESLPVIPVNYDPVTRQLVFDLRAGDNFSTGQGLEGRAPTCVDGLDNMTLVPSPPAGDGADENDPDCLEDDNPADSQPPRHNRSGYEDGNCDSASGNEDGDAFANAADPDCHTDGNKDNQDSYEPGLREQDTCADGGDNDGDGAADAADPQCRAPLNFAGDLEVVDGVNIQTQGNATLSAGFDLDLTFGVDLRDFPDSPTEGAGAPEDSCRDGLDNDGDDSGDGTETDAQDADCGKREAGGGPGSCADSIDNNNDGQADAEALECTLTEGPGAPAGSCYDGADNDNDIFEDLKDGDCTLALEDRLFIETSAGPEKDAQCTGAGDNVDDDGDGIVDDGCGGSDPAADAPGELLLDLLLEAQNVTASATIGILEVTVEADVSIGPSEDRTGTCDDNVNNVPADGDQDGDGADEADSDCHTEDDADTPPSTYSPLLAEDGIENADCNSNGDEDDDGPEIVDALVDIVEGGVPADDDGSFLGVTITDGLLDLNGDGEANIDDDGTLAGLEIIDGKVNYDGDTDVDNSDDGSFFENGNDPDCHILVVDLRDPDGRLTLPELLESINDLSTLVDANINAFADATVTVNAELNNVPLLTPGTINVSGGVAGLISVNGTEDGGEPDSCTDGVDNSDVINGPPDGNGDGLVDGEDPDCSPLLASLKIDTDGLGNLLDFNTDDPLALLIRLLETIGAMAEQMKGQENGILGEPIPLVGTSLVDIFSYADELAELLKGTRVEPEGNIVCTNNDDEDAQADDAADSTTLTDPPGDTEPPATDAVWEGVVNDGCDGVPVLGTPETDVPCAAGEAMPLDDDADGFVNDGCPARGRAEALCDGADDDQDGIVDDGCGSIEVDAVPESVCADATDEDNDLFFNDGCPVAQPTLQRLETQIEGLLDKIDPSKVQFGPDGDCDDSGDTTFGARDDDDDGIVNDGCAADGFGENDPANSCGGGDPDCGEVSACRNDTDDDGDTKINDGCPDNFEIEYDTVDKELLFHLGFGVETSTQASLNFDLGDLDVPPDLIGLETSGTFQAGVRGALNLDFGITIGGSSLDSIQPFIVNTSGLSLTASADATDFQVKGNIGPLNVFAGNASETTCGPAGDEDADGFHNEGCLSDGTPEGGTDCNNGTDDDDGGGGPVNEGCPPDLASAHLLGQLAIGVTGGDAQGRIPLSSFGASNFDLSNVLSGNNNAACPDIPGGGAGDKPGACASLPMYVGITGFPAEFVCDMDISVADLASPTFVLDDPNTVGLQDPTCDFADRIAAAALDMLLLESGLQDLLDMLENLLNGNLFGFQLPLVGNLGLGTSFVNSLQTGLVDSVTTGSSPADAFKTAQDGAVRDAVENFRSAIATELVNAGLLLERGNDGTPAGEVDDLHATMICGESAPGVLRECTFGGEDPSTQCNDAVDDDGDDYINDGCPVFPDPAGGPESGTQCDAGNATDDDDDNGNGAVDAPPNGLVNDGCGQQGGEPETGDQCSNATDDEDNDTSTPAPDLDGFINDGCLAGYESVGEDPSTGCEENDNTDDEDNYAESPAVADKDGRINDGCPAEGPEANDLTEIRFFASIGQLQGTTADLGFDLGMPGLGLTSNDSVTFGYEWRINLGFGVSKDHGFFLLTEPMEDGLTKDSCLPSDADPPDPPAGDDDGDGLANEADPDCDNKDLKLLGGIDLDGAAIDGRLAFLLVSAADSHGDNGATFSPEASAEFAIGINDPTASGPEADERLSFSEIVNAPSFGSVVRYGLAANVDLEIDLATTVDFDGGGADPAIPELLADLNIYWNHTLGNLNTPDQANPGDVDNNTGNPACDDAGDTNCFGVELDNLRIDIGTFLTSMVQPVALEIQKYTEPLQPAIDILTAPIPVLSDLAGEPITLLDLVILLGEGDLDFLDDVAAVITFVNSFDENGAENLEIPLSASNSPQSFTLNATNLLDPLGQPTDAFQPGDVNAQGDLIALATTNMLEDIQNGTDAASGASDDQKAVLAGLQQLTAEAGVSFPFLEKPSDLVQLLFGKDVTLVLWEPPNLRAHFAYSQSFGPIWAVPPVFVHIGGSVTLQGHFALGMDTEGIRALAAGGGAPDLLKGLFLGDYSNDQEVPEFSMRGELLAGAAVSVGIFSAGAEGGVFLTISIDLNDPNNDGKMKFTEIVDIIEITGNPLCIFIYSGEFGVFLRVFVEVDLFFWSQRWTYTLAEIVLLSFDVECDFDPHPILAHVDGDGDPDTQEACSSNCILILHMGTNADLRGAFDVPDEEFTVKKNLATHQLDVTAFGFTQGFCCDDTITLVQANGHTGKDKIAALPSISAGEDGIQTCGDGDDNSDFSNGPPGGNGDGGIDSTDDDCHTDHDAGDPVDMSTYDASLAEDGIDACSDGRDNDESTAPPDGNAADRGIKKNADADFGDPGEFPPDADCAQPVDFDIPVDFDGGADDDSLVSGVAADNLRGGGGKDSLDSNKGNDHLMGGDGDDELIAGEGNDDIYGDNGDDATLTWDNCGADPPDSANDAPEGADDGGDYVDGGLGQDRVCGQGKNDNLVGGLSSTDTTDIADTIRGGSGNDTIDGGDGGDSLYGDANNDNINGSGDSDTIEGGNEGRTAFDTDLGDDLLGGAGGDTIRGGEGDDNVVGGPGGDPELKGGDNDDVLLGDDGQITRIPAPPDTPDLNRYNDTVTLTPGSDEGADVMSGEGGNDWLFGQGGGDTMSGNDGNDDLIGGALNDTMHGGEGFDIMLGDAGFVDHDNTATSADDSAILITPAGSVCPSLPPPAEPCGDTMNGNEDDDDMFGQEGADTMNGGDDQDFMHGNAGNDTMNGNSGLDIMHGNAHDDIMRGNEHSDEMRGGSGADRMTGGSSGVESDATPDDGDFMFGESGNDVMAGDNANISPPNVDLLNLNPIGGNDYMEGNAGSDDMYGGPLRDEMHGNEGDDYMEGNNDIDLMTGDTGEDDMIGGTSVEAEPPAAAAGGVLDEGDLMTGNDGVDFIAGDNASIARPGGDDDRNDYNGAVKREVYLYDVAEFGAPVSATLSGGDNIAGGEGDDVIYGQGNGGHGVDDDGDGAVDEDVVDGVDNDRDGNEDGTTPAPGTGDCADGVGNEPDPDGKDAKDPQCLPHVDEDGGGDLLHGNNGHDFIEGNDGADTIFGDADQDDLIGGTGRTSTPISASADDGRLDGGDIINGGAGTPATVANDYDVMIGDNGVVARPLDSNNHWQVNDFNAAVVRVIHFYDVGMVAPYGSAAAAGTSGVDVMAGEANDDLMYGQGDNDLMTGGDGDDYMEGNAGADNLAGQAGNDDMAGGTGHIFQFFASPGLVVEDPYDGAGNKTGRDGRRDDGETGMAGGDGFDFMIGDNGVIDRETDDVTGAWLSNTFRVCAPLSACNGVQHKPEVLRDVQLLGVPVDPNTHGAEQDMAGGNHDDIMYGQGDNDEMNGNDGDDYMEGNHADDQMFGDDGQDDMLGGGSDDSDLANPAEPDLLDGDDRMHGDSDELDGEPEGSGSDVMIGDNGLIIRPLGSANEWQTLSTNEAFLRVITLFDVEGPGPAVSLDLSGDDDMWGNSNDDIMYGQGGMDDMFGGAGDDYMEGNAHSDVMHGNIGEDDMIGGTARTKTDDPSSFQADRTDTSTRTRPGVPLGANPAVTVPLGDEMYGEDGADEMLGDNGTIFRPVQSNEWITLTYSLLADTIGDVEPRHRVDGSSSRIDRDVATIDSNHGVTAGSDLMYGGNGDDQMYGQYDDTSGAVQPAIGDEMYGDNGEDAMAGDQGLFENRVLTGSSQHIEPNAPFINDDIFIPNSLFREFRMEAAQIPRGGNDRMRGGTEGDWMHGGAGDDVANGDNGNDRLFGNNGADDLWGGRHHDHLWGGYGSDQLDVHPRVAEDDANPNLCTQISQPDPQEWYTFAFEGGLLTTSCDGNFENIDYIYGGWDADFLQANVGDNGPRLGDRLIDWVGAYNLYILCPATYGEYVSTRQHSPSMTTFLHKLAEGDGAYQPGPTTFDPSGFNDIGFVHKKDLKNNNSPPAVDTPGHFNCTTDTTTTP